MKNTRLLLILTATLFTLNVSAQADKVLLSDKWKWSKIADKTVRENSNRDEIAISDIERYTAIKVVVKEAEINMYNLELSYAGGNGQSIAVTSDMKAGSESQIYGLDTSKRDLIKVAFTYEALTPIGNEETQIEIWGLKTINDLK